MIKAKKSHPPRYIQRLLVTSLCVASLNVETVMAASAGMTGDMLLDICASTSVNIASQKGKALGWHKLTDKETEEWISVFIGYDAESVEMVGWRSEEGGLREDLSFWTTSRLSGARTCSYSSSDVAGLFESLSERLGPPDNFDRDDAKKGMMALWLRNNVEYSYVQVCSSAIVTIGSAR